MRLLAALALFFVLTGCQSDSHLAALTPRAIDRFRTEFSGNGDRWTSRVPIDPNGGYVVREFRDLSVEILPKPVAGSDAASGVTWCGMVVVRYWSRIVEAPDWRGPKLPTFWDQYAVGYPARLTGSGYVLDQRTDA